MKLELATWTSQHLIMAKFLPLIFKSKMFNMIQIILLGTLPDVILPYLIILFWLIVKAINADITAKHHPQQ